MLRQAAPAEVETDRQVAAVRFAELSGRAGRWSVRLAGHRIAAVTPERGELLGRDELDARGMLVVPGFHDPHLHLLATARQVVAPRLDPRLRGLGALAKAIAAAAVESSSEWVHLTAFDHETMTAGHVPDRSFLDAVCGDRPVRVQHRNLRLDVLNSEALRRCGVAAGLTPGGFEVGPCGTPTGRVHQAGSLIRDLARVPADPAPVVAELSRELLRHGLTSVHDAGEANGTAELALLDRLANDGVVHQRLHVMVSAARLLDGELDHALLVRTTHAKLVAVESRLDPDRLEAEALAARAAGLGVAIHATSDAEVAAAVHTIRVARRRDAEPASRGTYRIEHASVAPNALVEAVVSARAAIVASPSLVRIAGDSYLDAHPESEHGALHRLATWRRAGVVLALASDAPVTPARPLEAIEAACTRRTASGRTLGAAEMLDEPAALTASTSAPAVLAGCGDELGRILPGFLADLAVVRRRGSGFGDAEVVATVLDGRLVYAAGEA